MSHPKLPWVVFFGLSLLLLSVWCSSGTLSPYAASLFLPQVDPECHYLFNVDHPHFEAQYKFVDGEAKESWSFAATLRRPFFYLVGYPFMKTLGFVWGGFVTSLLLISIAYLIFSSWVLKHYGERAAIAASLLLATYPGFNYWGGLPYPYATITPCILIFMVLLDSLERRQSTGSLIALSLTMGVLFTAYDLWPFFGVAALFCLWPERKKKMFACALSMAAPTLLVLVWVSLRSDLFAARGNGDTFYNIFRGFTGIQWKLWAHYLLQLPLSAPKLFLYSNFIWLPLLFLGLWGGFRKQVGLSRSEKGVLIAALALFLLTNTLPPYPGWQMRGDWLARLYQPLMGVLICYTLRVVHFLKSSKMRGVSIAILITVTLNAGVQWGPLLNLPLAPEIYYRFYAHSVPGAVTGTEDGSDNLVKNLDRFGRRPLGFCLTGDTPVD